MINKTVTKLRNFLALSLTLSDLYMTPFAMLFDTLSCEYFDMIALIKN